MILWSILRMLGLAAASALAAFVVDRAAELTVRRLAAGRAGSGTLPLVRGCRRPFLLAGTAALMLAGEASVGLAPQIRDAVRHVLVLLCLAACGWLAARLVALLVDAGVRLSVRSQDASRVRRARTQAGMLRRVCQAVIAVVALAAMLMTFPAVRTLGASLLASAGLVGVVAAMAAQSTLGNLFAGVQMAFGDMVRIGDEVVVAGEWGTVEEITLTYVVVATWDQRRIVMPVSYFAGRPFENWSRNDTRITATALLHLDHSTPMGELRVEFDALLAKCDLWDGEGSALQVVDTTPSCIVVRALMTARNAGDAFDLRCHVREELIGHLREHHPGALPRLTLAGTDADGAVGAGRGCGCSKCCRP
ncbi:MULTISPECIES: mechanosensitive ion channel family protein [unclassified Kitasatospora]|uniref:mechanosensitive ion channel family protein n=1 Tax=unclassified Kitasatospora TaxID=2633591 RepID=UPI000AF46235|nr:MULTISPECIES: mechanosensitive ion channel domain-containing protein [unclassified Kitasatospora]